MRVVGAYKHGAKRVQAAKLAGVLRRTSSRLIRSRCRDVGVAIDDALADLGETLGADRVVVATGESPDFVVRHVWERRGTEAHTPLAPGESLRPLPDGVRVKRTIVFTNRKQFPSIAGSNGKSPSAPMSSAIFVPLQDGAKAPGVLAVTASAPQPWAADAVETAERVAEMLAAGLERMASPGSLLNEQEKRIHAEAETGRVRDPIAHAGRVSMLGEIAGSLAHELNQPLTAIYTNAQAAHRLLAGTQPAIGEALSALDDVGQDCRRAGELVSRLRQVFR